ncbi:hypothetical protein BLNAU_9680 [Blattamonas nauphoetae]|uniref:Uncharacterized protein n=1 Tax=Blattamonas nauphoetae TaxID=2049346 RepID=A0ABQ9XUY1_9EUKA|nr:hypothetical protein BLNAU_9680 [Blattamonas nauphoetae]
MGLLRCLMMKENEKRKEEERERIKKETERREELERLSRESIERNRILAEKEKEEAERRKMLEEEKLMEARLKEESQQMNDTSQTAQEEISQTENTPQQSDSVYFDPPGLMEDNGLLKQTKEHNQSHPETDNEKPLQTEERVGSDEETKEEEIQDLIINTVSSEATGTNDHNQKPSDITAVPILPPSESSPLTNLQAENAVQSDREEILARTAQLLARTTLHAGEQEQHVNIEVPTAIGTYEGNMDYLEDLSLSDESSSTTSESISESALDAEIHQLQQTLIAKTDLDGNLEILSSSTSPNVEPEPSHDHQTRTTPNSNEPTDNVQTQPNNHKFEGEQAHIAYIDPKSITISDLDNLFNGTNTITEPRQSAPKQQAPEPPLPLSENIDSPPFMHSIPDSRDQFFMTSGMSLNGPLLAQSDEIAPRIVIERQKQTKKEEKKEDVTRSLRIIDRVDDNPLKRDLSPVVPENRQNTVLSLVLASDTDQIETSNSDSTDQQPQLSSLSEKQSIESVDAKSQPTFEEKSINQSKSASKPKFDENFLSFSESGLPSDALYMVELALIRQADSVPAVDSSSSSQHDTSSHRPILQTPSLASPPLSSSPPTVPHMTQFKQELPQRMFAHFQSLPPISTPIPMEVLAQWTFFMFSSSLPINVKEGFIYLDDIEMEKLMKKARNDAMIYLSEYKRKKDEEKEVNTMGAKEPAMKSFFARQQEKKANQPQTLAQSPLDPFFLHQTSNAYPVNVVNRPSSLVSHQVAAHQSLVSQPPQPAHAQQPNSQPAHAQQPLLPQPLPRPLPLPPIHQMQLPPHVASLVTQTAQMPQPQSLNSSSLRTQPGRVSVTLEELETNLRQKEAGFSSMGGDGGKRQRRPKDRKRGQNTPNPRFTNAGRVMDEMGQPVPTMLTESKEQRFVLRQLQPRQQTDPTPAQPLFTSAIPSPSPPQPQIAARISHPEALPAAAPQSHQVEQSSPDAIMSRRSF